MPSGTVATPIPPYLSGILNAQTVTKPELYNCDVCNGVSLAEQNAIAILHQFQPRYGSYKRERGPKTE